MLEFGGTFRPFLNTFRYRLQAQLHVRISLWFRLYNAVSDLTAERFKRIDGLTSSWAVVTAIWGHMVGDGRAAQVVCRLDFQPLRGVSWGRMFLAHRLSRRPDRSRSRRAVWLMPRLRAVARSLGEILRRWATASRYAADAASSSFWAC
jgi:hypothetical protein